MANGNGQSAGKAWLEEYPELRNKYFYGQMVTADDLHNAQDYLLERIKALSLLLNGPGVVYGLDVTNVRRGNTWPDITLDLAAGFAVDGLGRHVVVPSDVEGEGVLFEAEEGMPLKEPQRGDVIIFYLEREECRTGKIPAYGGPSPCGRSCCYSRIKESYRVTGRVRSADDFTAVLEKIAEYYKKVDHEPLGIKGDASIYDVLKLILRYADRYQPSVSVFLDELTKCYRVNDRGGVAIWATRYGNINDASGNTGVYQDPDDLDADTVVNLFRRNVLSNDTLAQMIAEHATDYDNPHRTPVARTKVITGKYKVPDFTPVPPNESETATHILKVGKLTRDGEPVTGTVTSVAVGLAYSLKFNEKLSEFSDSCGEFWEQELDSQEKKEILLQARYTSELLFGYNIRFPAWQDQATDGSDPVEAFLAQVSPGTFKEFEADFTVVPKVEYEDVDGRNVPKLTLKLIENVSPAVVVWSAEVYGDYESYIDSTKFPERPPLLDCAFTIYWSAAITEKLDMVRTLFTFPPWRRKYKVPKDMGVLRAAERRSDLGLVAWATTMPEDIKKFRNTTAEAVCGMDFGKELLSVLDEAMAVAEKAREYAVKKPPTTPTEIEDEVAKLREAPADVVAAVAGVNDALVAGLDGTDEERADVLKAMGVGEGATEVEVMAVKEAVLRRAVAAKKILAEKSGG